MDTEFQNAMTQSTRDMIILLQGRIIYAHLKLDQQNYYFCMFYLYCR